MDPNATLTRIRKLTTEGHFDCDEYRELFGDLDDWLSRGGFLPDAWRKGLPTPSETTDGGIC